MSHRSYWTFILPLLLLILLGTGCEEDTSTGPEIKIPMITGWALPAKMAYNSPRTDRIVIIVEYPNGPANLQTMVGTILSGGTVIDTFSLLDDGSQYSATPHPPWATDVSGDLIPLDGFFSRRITGQFVDQPTQVTFRFKVADNDGHNSYPLEVAVEVRANTPPTLEDPVLPDTLYSGFDTLTISIRALESDDLDSVTQVWLDVLGSGKDDLELSGPDADNRWSLEIDASFAAGILGSYPFEFYAEDTFHEIAGPLSQQVYVENEPPTLSNLVMIDTFYLPPPEVGSDTTEIFLEVADEQTLADIAEVTFTSVLNDTVPNPNVFYLFDDGFGADQTAGDGIFSVGIVLFSNNTPGKYEFTFIAEDLVGQQSTPISQVLWVLPPPSGLSNASTMPKWLLPSFRNDRLCNPFQTERRDR